MTAMAVDDFLATLKAEQERSFPILEKVFAAAQPGAVFGAPLSADGYTIITACEIAAGGGFGSGLGSAPAPQANEAAGTQNVGGGAGGGGGAQGRPVAVIIVGPDGVSVKPIVDPTKIALAAITAWGAMAMLLGRMSRRPRPGARPQQTRRLPALFTGRRSAVRRR
jgi:uncharacterized spore protein YtfJ